MSTVNLNYWMCGCGHLLSASLRGTCVLCNVCSDDGMMGVDQSVVDLLLPHDGTQKILREQQAALKDLAKEHAKREREFLFSPIRLRP